MLSKQDDFIGHQLPTTFDHVMSSDPAWMERLWYTGHPIPGAISSLTSGSAGTPTAT